MSDELKPLIETLTALLADESIKSDRGAWLGQDFQEGQEGQETIFQEIEGHACVALIKDDGRPNFAAMRALSVALPGVKVGPGEVDSFGWLSGVIHTPKGMIVYG